MFVPSVLVYLARDVDGEADHGSCRVGVLSIQTRMGASVLLSGMTLSFDRASVSGAPDTFPSNVHRPLLVVPLAASAVSPRSSWSPSLVSGQRHAGGGGGDVKYEGTRGRDRRRVCAECGVP